MPTVPPVAVRPRESVPFAFITTSLSRGYLPARGLPYSLLAHGLAVILIFFFSALPSPTDPFHPAPPAKTKKYSELVTVMWLPDLRPGAQGVRGRLESPPGNRPPAASASGTKGLIYPGPQQIVSDVPLPTNDIQTLLQPALENPPILEPPLALPNIVQIADAGPAPTFRPPDLAVRPPDTVKPEEEQPAKPSAQEEITPTEPSPAVESQPPTPVDALELEMPAPLPLPKTARPELVIAPPPARTVAIPKDSKPLEPLPEPVKAEPKTDPPPAKSEEPKGPPPVELSPMPSRGTDQRSLVALTPMPTVREQPADIPSGEARGRFAISPEPDLAVSGKEPGSTVAKNAPSPVVPGNPTLAPAGGNAAGNPPSVVTISFGPSGDVKEKGSESGGGGASGSRLGPAAGPGVGSGSGAGLAPGPGPGNGPFAGITIIGGEGGTGTAASAVPRTRTPRPLQTSYGVFVVSTEKGGGGLPFVGVFSNEQIYTVYLDMRQTESDSDPLWTLEFALLEKTPAQARTGRQQGLVLPFPAVKRQPALPPDLVRRHIGEMVLVYAVINAEGKMEQISVKQSPDPLLNEPVRAALGTWVFRPAAVDGDPVAVKALLGIPLSLPEYGRADSRADSRR